MSHTTRRLRTPLHGALAGGGDPASSPLYVFGPSLRLLVAAGVANVAFGATLWLVVLTFLVVSTMYRQVMIWITDGSGGSGLSGEEFGESAVKLSAAITFIEYTLTFLVSMAALVTFIADRLPTLNDTAVLVENRTWLAVALSVMTASLVNRGSTTTARVFGPATGAVLLLLWGMIVATIARTGVRLPSFEFDAFDGPIVGTTLGGYVRLLAAMTGVEVFANLVGAFEGPPEERSRNAFRGLLIVMGTTGSAMIIIGPAVQRFADPLDPDVSVFTQTMDRLLPTGLARLGTVVGVAVLLSACAASAIGLQNLFVGLRLRHYIPAPLGRINRFGVADRPVWLEAAIASACFVAFGTREDTYLALYAAGVFVLLAMTGWAALKRLLRERRDPSTPTSLPVMAGTAVAATLTTAATLTIFVQRFADGTWAYLVMIPGIMSALSYYRRRLGRPSPIEDLIGASVGGGTVSSARDRLDRFGDDTLPDQVVIAVDGSAVAWNGLPIARAMAEAIGADVRAVRVAQNHGPDISRTTTRGFAPGPGRPPVEIVTACGSVAATLCGSVAPDDRRLLVISTRGRSGPRRAVFGSVAAESIRLATSPIVIVPPRARTGGAPVPGAAGLRRILVALDGSAHAEQVLPYVSAIARLDVVEDVVLVHIPSGGPERERPMQSYLDIIAESLEHTGTRRVTIVGGHDPLTSLAFLAREHRIDLMMLASHGRGGIGRLLIGSVADAVTRTSPTAVYVVPVQES